MGKKFLHIMPVNTSKTNATIEMIRKDFNSDEHVILIWATKDGIINYNPRLLSFLDLVCLPDSVQKKRVGNLIKASFIKKMMDSVDYVVWHSLDCIKGKFVILCCTKEKYLKKSIWIETGADLYSWRRANTTLKNKIYNYLMKKMRTKIKAVGFTIPTDRKEYDRQFPDSKAPLFFDLPIPFEAEILRILNDYAKIKKKNQKPIIWLGYTGHPINRHLSIIDRLGLLDSKDFKLILPMNFAMLLEYGANGNYRYRQRLLEYSERILGIRATKLCRWGVEPEKYFNIINTVDVAIFNCRRLSNPNLLFYFLYLNKKVFLTSGDPLYSFLKEKGVAVFDANEIEMMDCQEFFRNDGEGMPNEYLLEYFNNEKISEKWNQLFQMMNEG